MARVCHLPFCMNQSAGGTYSITEFPGWYDGAPVYATTPALNSPYTAKYGNGYAGYLQHSLTAAGALVKNRTYYGRAYLQIAEAPTVAWASFIHLINANIRIQMNTDRTVRLYNVASAAIIGSASSALALDTKHRIEWAIRVDTTAASSTMSLRINGVLVVNNVTTSIAAVPGYLGLGDYTGQSPFTSGNQWCFGAVALNDDQGGSQNSWVNDSTFRVAVPISDNARTGWTGGAGGTTNLYDAVDQVPPVGVVVASATNTSQIVDATANATDNVDLNMQSYTTLGVPSGDTIMLVQPIAQVGNNDTTNRAFALDVTSNPASSGEVSTTPTAAAAVGTSPSNWRMAAGPIVYTPLPTRGTSPVVRLGRRTATAGTVTADFIGLLVEHATIPPISGTAAGTGAATGTLRTPTLTKRIATGAITCDETTLDSAHNRFGTLAIVSNENKVETDSTDTSFPYKRKTKDALSTGHFDLQVHGAVVCFNLHPVTANDATYALRITFWQDSNDYRELRIAKTASGTSELRDMVAGTPTSRGTCAKGVAVATTKKVKFKAGGAAGNTYSANIDGTTIAAWTDGAPLTSPRNITVGAPTGFANDVRLGRFTVCTSDTIHFSVPTGYSVRIYNEAGSVAAQGVESGGVVALDMSAEFFPFNGRATVFSDGASYSVAATQGSTQLMELFGGDEFRYDPPFHVISTEGAWGYPTTQTNGDNGAVYNGDSAMGIYMGREKSVRRFHVNLVTGVTQDEEHATLGSIADQHATCDVKADSNGYLHAIYDGVGAGGLMYMKSNTPYGWNDWGTAVAITGMADTIGGLVITSDDTMVVVATKGVDQLVWTSKPAAGGSWSTPVKIIETGQPTWVLYFGELTIDDNDVIGVSGFSHRDDYSVYQDAWYARTVDKGVNWRGIKLGNRTLPMTMTAGGVITDIEKIYSGTGAYIPRICHDPARGYVHVLQTTLGPTTYTYYRGDSTNGFVNMTDTFPNFNTGATIAMIGDVVTMIAAVVGTPSSTTANTLRRSSSPDGGDNWQAEETLVTDDPYGADTGESKQWYWAKATPIPGSPYLRSMWHVRKTAYCQPVAYSGSVTGDGSSAVYLVDVEAIAGLVGGTAAGTGAATGTLSFRAAISGTAAGTGAATGTLTTPSSGAALTGSATGTGSISATLTVTTAIGAVVASNRIGKPLTVPPITVVANGRDLTLEHDGLRFSNSDPGGYESVSLNPKDLAQLYPGNTVEVFCGLQRLGWYTINDPAESSRGDRSSYAIEGLGPGEQLKRDQMREIFVDRDLSKWGSPSASRSLAMYDASPRINTPGSFSVVGDPAAGLPALLQQFDELASNGPGGAYDRIETWYDAQGLVIGGLYYDQRRKNIGAGWNQRAYLTANDTATSNQDSGDLSAADSAGYLTANATRYFAFLLLDYPGVFTGRDTWQAYWRKLAVYGNHGLTRRGPDPGGFFTGDIVRYVARKAGVALGPIADGTYIVPHLTYFDLTEHEAIVDEMSKLEGGWHYGMWMDNLLADRPELWYVPPPANATAVVRKDACPSMEVPRVRLDQLFNRANVSYRDGATKPGIVTVDLANPLLSMTTIGVRAMPVDAGICNATQARQIGQIALLLQQRTARGSGSATLPDFVDTPSGPMPSCMLKAGRDRICIPDLPDPGPMTEGDTRRFDTFHVRRVETTVAEGRPVTTVEFDGGSDLLETFKRRADLDLLVAGVS